jgi:hypothetical protein
MPSSHDIVLDMKKLMSVGLVVGLAVTGMGVSAVTNHFINNYPKNESKKTAITVSECKQKGKNHLITLQDDQMVPKHTDAQLCDTLTVVNRDPKLRLMAFGVHSRHVHYDGVSEKQLGQGQNFSVTLNQTGTYKIHDHHQDEVQGNFTVDK